MNLLGIFALVITACSKYDDASTENSSPFGTYRLTAFNISQAQDLNGDGTSSANQMNESICLNSCFLTLNANNTFTYDVKGIEITFDGTNEQITCYDDGDVSGTWSINGSVLTLTSGGMDNTYTFSGNTNTISVSDSDVVGTSG